jgi:hypothetical protein
MDGMPKHASRLPVIPLKELYPGLSDQELAEIDERLDRYVLLCVDIYESIERDPKRLAEFLALTNLTDTGMVKDESL